MPYLHIPEDIPVKVILKTVKIYNLKVSINNSCIHSSKKTLQVAYTRAQAYMWAPVPEGNQ